MINKSEIIEYIKLICNTNNTSLGEDLLKGVKKHILKKDKFNNEYIKKHIIADIDRKIDNFEKDKDFVLDDTIIDMLAETIKTALYDERHFFPIFKESIIRAIRDKEGISFVNNKISRCSIWSDEVEIIFLLISIIENIKLYAYLLKLCDEDERFNLNKKRDSIKIDNAIYTLKKYTNDLNLIYYLSNLQIHKRDVTRETIYSCLFCDSAKMIKEVLPNISDDKLEHIAQGIVNIFKPNKEKPKDEKNGEKAHYKICKYTKIIEYKGYKLRQYSKKQPL